MPDLEPIVWSWSLGEAQPAPVPGEWQTVYVPWDQLETTLVELSPATTYELQIRAVDYASPINYGAWSAAAATATATDTTPPGTPAAPTVAASRLAIQVTHTLGLASGGTYNLPLDLDHLEVHVGPSAGYTPDATTRVGKVAANAGMILGGIPAVATFDVDATTAVHVKVVAVDRTGNRSTPSSAATATALLVDSAHISDLTASKITAGTISAALLLSGSIKTGTSGARVEQDLNGIRLYNSSGSLTADLSTTTGDATITGTFRTGLPGTTHVEITPTGGNGTIYFRPANGSSPAYINSPTGGGSVALNAAASAGVFGRAIATPATVEMAILDGSQNLAGGMVSVAQGYAVMRVNSTVAEVVDGAWQATYGAAYTRVSASSWVGSGGDAYVWCRASDMDIQGSGQVNLYAGTIYIGAAAGNNVRSDAIYNNTGTFAANVGISTTPIARFYRLTSSARYKTGITEIGVPLDEVMRLVPVAYYDRGQAEAQDGSTAGLSRQVGLIAEQVAGLPVLGPLLVEAGVDGAPEAVNYERLAVCLLGAVRTLAERVSALDRKPRPPEAGRIPAEVLALSDAPITRHQPPDAPVRHRRDS